MKKRRKRRRKPEHEISIECNPENLNKCYVGMVEAFNEVANGKMPIRNMMGGVALFVGELIVNLETGQDISIGHQAFNMEQAMLMAIHEAVVDTRNNFDMDAFRQKWEEVNGRGN